jgi:electron transfer flavoprotein beta subunit
MSDNKFDILVLLRETCDPRPPVRLNADGFGVRERGLRRIVNPADLCAVEQALSLAGPAGGKVTAVAIGPARLDDHLRLALSMGAGRVVRVWNSLFQGGDAVAAARVTQRVIDILSPDLVFTGSRLLDRGDDSTVALAAANLGIPCLSGAVELKWKGSEVEVLRKSDRGARQRVGAKLPCAVLFEEGSCEPRYPDQEALMRAAGAKVETWGLAELGLPAPELGAAGSLLGRAECAFPRPKPLRVVTPDANLPAFERILALLSGGIKPREGKMHAVSAEKTADMLVDIFKAEGLIGGSGT